MLGPRAQQADIMICDVIGYGYSDWMRHVVLPCNQNGYDWIRHPVGASWSKTYRLNPMSHVHDIGMRKDISQQYLTEVNNPLVEECFK